MAQLPIVILAGGLATRLRPITEKIPKALVEVAGKPFLAHQLAQLRAQGITDIVLCVGYLGEMIRDSFGDGGECGVSIRYSFDGPELLGTAGAIRKALPLLGDDFFVLYGDSYLPIDFPPVAETYLASGCSALMTVFRNEGKWDASNVWFEDGVVRCYDKKAALPQMHHIDYGLSVWSRDAFIGSEAVADLADLFRRQVDLKQLAGYEVSERFYEIGSHSGLQELDRLFRNPDSAQSL